MQNEDQWSGFELLWVLSEHLLKHLNVENGIVEGVITRLNPDGAVILPGDSANSILFKIQSVGNHFANLSSEELDIVKQWIDAGAPQK